MNTHIGNSHSPSNTPFHLSSHILSLSSNLCSRSSLSINPLSIILSFLLISSWNHHLPNKQMLKRYPWCGLVSEQRVRTCSLYGQNVTCILSYHAIYCPFRILMTWVCPLKRVKEELSMPQISSSLLPTTLSESTS